MRKMLRIYVFLILVVVNPAAFGQEDVKVKGSITSSLNESLPGVNIVLKGKSIGSITDVEGNYELMVSDPVNDVLVFRFIGLADQEVTVKGQTRIDVVMEDNIIGLDEVVAIGYGIMRKSDLTGSVASIKAEDIANNPTNNALKALQGKISGLDLTRSSSQAGSGLNFKLRGERSLKASNSPLILVGCVDCDSNMDINPSDIASMEVLKDASSTAIPVEALPYLNQLRRTRAVPGNEVAIEDSSAELNIDFILDERARKFVGEQMRWFDLKRTGKLVERVKEHNPDAALNINKGHIIRPYPQDFLDAITNNDDFPQRDNY